MDLFTGHWTLNHEASRFAIAAPAEWTQDIEASADRLCARERIVSLAGAVSEHSIDARFDGAESPVTGSPLVDTMAYTRTGPRRIDGVARKSGVVVFRETVIVSDDGDTMAARLAIQRPDGGTLETVAVFDRAVRQAEGGL
jgi:hypothetical protein